MLKIKRKELFIKIFFNMEDLNKWLFNNYGKIDVLTMSSSGEWKREIHVFYYDKR